MSEIYRDSVSKAAVLDVPNAQVSSVKFVRAGKQVGDIVTSITTDPESNKPRVSIPYAVTHLDGDFFVEWTFTFEGNTYTRKNQHTVVTPLFTLSDLKMINPAFENYTQDQYVSIEKIVRGVVEAITGQSFGYEFGEVEMYGGGDGMLSSPKRVLSIDGISHNSYVLPLVYRPVYNGFGIEATRGYWSGGTFESVSPIASPYFYQKKAGRFADDVKFVVTGEFGWYAVPEDITKAALLMAEVYACSEASYRDRYLRAVSAADWRFDFHDLAFHGTGSVTADTLLSPYVVSRMAIV